MSENVVLLLANIIVIIAWFGAALFVGFYFFKSPWRATLPGRTLMYSKLSMLLLLTYALTARWFLQDLPQVNYAIGLFTYSLIAFMLWRIFLVLRYIQTGRVTQENPNYTPIRNLWRRLFKKDK